jgi:hypothetical protein
MEDLNRIKLMSHVLEGAEEHLKIYVSEQPLP